LIRYKIKDYKSPSQAAKAVVKRAANGWAYWKYERAPGNWVSLKRYDGKHLYKGCAEKFWGHNTNFADCG
jgi:hypothetical protein